MHPFCLEVFKDHNEEMGAQQKKISETNSDLSLLATNPLTKNTRTSNPFRRNKTRLDGFEAKK